MERKYNLDYFLGGVDPVTKRPYGVLGHEAFRAGKVPERGLKEFEFTRLIAGPLAGSEILEIGFGRGDLVPLFLEAGVSGYSGIDFSASAVQIARNHFKDPRVRFLRREATKLPKGRAFDLIVLYDVVEHVPVYEMEVVWRKIRDALRPGGRVVLSTPIFENPNAADHSDEIPAVCGMHCHKQSWATLARAALRHGFTPIGIEDRMLAWAKTEDLPLFDEERRRTFQTAKSRLEGFCGLEAPLERLSSDQVRALLPGAGRMALGCVVENSPGPLAQALRLLQSLRWFGGCIAGANVFICVVGGVEPACALAFEQFGAFVRPVGRLGGAHPNSSKLRFLQLPELNAYDTILLLDSDCLVVQDPWPYLDGACCQAGIRHASSVPPAIWTHLFDHFGIKRSAQPYCNFPARALADRLCRDSVLILPQPLFRKLAPAWIEFHTALADRPGLLGAYASKDLDVSLSLALAAKPVAFSPLPLEMDLPLDPNREIRLAEKGSDPVILHCRDRVDAEGYLERSLHPEIQQRIEQFNQRLRAYRCLFQR